MTNLTYGEMAYNLPLKAESLLCPGAYNEMRIIPHFTTESVASRYTAAIVLSSTKARYCEDEWGRIHPQVF